MEINEISKVAYKTSYDAGWYIDPETGEDYSKKWYCAPVKLMLAVTELAEAVEGHRQDLADDKLPQYPMLACEMADTVIRICCEAENMGYDLDEIIQAKMSFNTTRPDHKLVLDGKPRKKKY